MLMDADPPPHPPHLLPGVKSFVGYGLQPEICDKHLILKRLGVKYLILLGLAAFYVQRKDSNAKCAKF